MSGRTSQAERRVLAELRRRGVLLMTDARLPSLAALVADSPLRGSWWAHAQSHEIFRMASRLAARPDVLTPRFVGGKVTFVARRLWPALAAVGAAREPWQLEGLSRLAETLLARVERLGFVRMDELAGEGLAGEKMLGRAARELEARLLVYGEQLHTTSGAHTKRLESWQHLGRRRRFSTARMSAEAARREFEEIAAALAARYRTRIRLPWGDVTPTPPRVTSSWKIKTSASRR